MRQHLLLLGIGIFVGTGIGIAITKSTITPASTSFLPSPVSEERLGGYKLISPLLDCDQNATAYQPEYRPSKQAIQDYINEEQQNNVVTNVSVYYRDLNNGPWFGINEKADFSPASLLKVPVMMAYFREAQTNPSILQKKILFTTSLGITDQFFKPQQSLTPNTSYTVDDLIARMIKYSDNDATWLLENNIDNSRIDKVTLDLGIATATNATPDDYMSVKDYSSLYRVLYNASYLDANYSEKALELLSFTDFPSGISASLPRSITVADKFGERELNTGTKQLHDCGIVYYPNHPYLLCIMTRGTDYTQLAHVIEQVSAKLYSDIHARYH